MQYGNPISKDIAEILASHGLRDTQPRRLVLQTLLQAARPLSQKDIFESIRKRSSAINLVTVYRMLRQFEECGIVHLHPTTGGYVICTEFNPHACHSFMTCEKCGGVEEFHDEKLCAEEHRIAKNAGFLPRYHVSDIVGVCARCR